MDTWLDEHGNEYKVPSPKRRINHRKYKLHAILRAFIHRRDKFKCKLCGVFAMVVPDYDGSYAIDTTAGLTFLVVDHIRSIARGGTNHPDNLQILCDSCNARKSCLEEGAGK